MKGKPWIASVRRAWDSNQATSEHDESREVFGRPVPREDDTMAMHMAHTCVVSSSSPGYGLVSSVPSDKCWYRPHICNFILGWELIA